MGAPREPLFDALVGFIRRDKRTSLTGDAVAIINHFETLGVDRSDAEAMLTGGPQRLHAYRDLVGNRLAATVRGVLTRTTQLVGNRLAADIAAFLAVRGPATHDMSDVAEEFVAFIAPAWHGDLDLPPHVHDLARFEATMRAVRSAGGRTPASMQVPLPLAPDLPVCFDGSVRVERFAFAVHRLAADAPPNQAPQRRDMTLLFYRRPTDHAVRYYSLSIRDATLIAKLLAGATLSHAIQSVAAATPNASLDTALQNTAKLLAKLSERGVVLGSVAP